MKKNLVLAFVLLAFPAAVLAGPYTVPVGDSPSLGPSNAPVTIVEFIDFQ